MESQQKCFKYEKGDRDRLQGKYNFILIGFLHRTNQILEIEAQKMLQIEESTRVKHCSPAHNGRLEKYWKTT